MWWTDYWPMPWMLFAPAMMIIFMIVCAAMMFFMMRGGVTRRSGGARAYEILDERYARGEISQTELEERRRILEGISGR